MGAVLGFAVGLTGTGGAGLAIPGLVLLLGFSTVTAVATTFPFAAIIKLIGFIQHRKQGTVHLQVGVALLLGGVPGSILGVLALSQLFDAYGEDLDLWLNMAIGGLIILGLVIVLTVLVVAGIAPPPQLCLPFSRIGQPTFPLRHHVC
ncbi:MAG: sulfite exporter TauE/SafE family protein [Chloroflexi bacterium]|nr:sulfite exporter TauE/SafE family protein [Chloroflexota bacterium]